MSPYFHSVTLDEVKCKGCTNCIKRCPTEAIRVRKSKARIINERCIDCGECIRVCPYHAKKAITDPIGLINDYKYKVAIPAPSLYGQLKSAPSRDHILTALKMCGFDDVFEVARAAEIITSETKKILAQQRFEKPLISSACPAVVRLIQVRFPNLIDNILKLKSPMEVAAKIAKDEISRNRKIRQEDIGVFFITPCAAKVTSIKAPLDKEKSFVDGAISISEIYLKILSALGKIDKPEKLSRAGFVGVRWANSGGESIALGTDKFLAVDGIHNVIAILEEIEDEKLEDIDFVEALACQGGCLGGPLNVENMYVARKTIKKFIDDAKEKGLETAADENCNYDIAWTGKVEYKPVMKLDKDFDVAMKKLETLNVINSGLPGLDCGACGAPSCRALAEDIVRGNANETDCIFKLREKVRDLAFQMMELEAKMPPVLDKDETSENKSKKRGEF
ncbi:MAG TPA: 4Fe-4S dicluster domain-containing protein [Hungateiclostridium thermocellum]|jgi:iron only hydrogenase large subunit-like protein|uniref:Fe-S cluster domain protein n=2 Tax=Acetivibrio thermocellus TaxID=1515 RepID=A3DC94_ACET2|nr:[Fe-Fe] hydrogenase large subunit C-terminal domain-containing protein [Acetivibrio thermocellus]CDG35013.1 hydrogenase large subunit-like protein [Acetivibrio thermocellus BC1]ABN51573.1 Fe-S cluster domain protein [Acetivibrio thermocellus ATCC 27405]ADU74940.1 Fe-S cluster domain protein [Acetivibrio thermocellus DSM 1313]ALX08900.1 hydrogenase large subunit domain protein [Acetivibrio thermocellus AD2]ANV76650.1 hydrogenase large subunit domain protein [Acetivibrio thermocellus DSM 2360